MKLRNESFRTSEPCLVHSGHEHGWGGAVGREKMLQSFRRQSGTILGEHEHDEANSLQAQWPFLIFRMFYSHCWFFFPRTHPIALLWHTKGIKHEIKLYSFFLWLYYINFTLCVFFINSSVRINDLEIVILDRIKLRKEIYRE